MFFSKYIKKETNTNLVRGSAWIKPSNLAAITPHWASTVVNLKIWFCCAKEFKNEIITNAKIAIALLKQRNCDAI